MNVMFEITISPPAAWGGPGEVVADGDGGSVDEDCPFGLAGAEEGADSSVPPHAMSTAAESRSYDIRVTMRTMSSLPLG